MADHDSPAFSWVCPRCTRRVPNKIDACRCGYVHEAEPQPAEVTAPPVFAEAPIADIPPVVSHSHAPRQRSVAAALKGGAVAAAGGLAVFMWMQVRHPDAARAQGAVPFASARVAADTLGATSAVPPASDRRTDPGSGALLEDVIGRAMPAVVRIESARGTGSGFFVAPDTLLTNMHVVGDNDSVTVRRADGRTSSARVDTKAPELDIAVLRIDDSDSTQAVLTMGSGIQARPGQEVVALGTPLGLQNTVTRGIVSAVREVGGVTLVQTDAAINPGNSGGPLIDRAGRAIGIATMGIESATAQGLAFGIAIDHARDLLAGQRPTTTAPTPLAGLNQAMNGGAGDSAATQEQILRQIDMALAFLSRRADLLDVRWRSFRGACLVGQVTGSFDREWFALWEPQAFRGTVSRQCVPIVADLRRAADDIAEPIVTLLQGARRAGIDTTTMRNMLRKYRLDYSGWDR
jgi:hypothetical protein